MRQTNWLTIILLMLTVPMLAQTVTQKGVAYQYNGKKARTPLGNVSISYDADKRTVVSDGQNGSFTLMLEKRRMGDRIGLVTVKKREMMVFNQHAVDEWSVRKEPLMLILCNAEEFERQKENLISIGRREAKKKYDRQKAELERQVAEGKMQIAEKDAALDKAYDELDRLNKNVGEYADLFARIDESEIDTLAQRALDLYNQGQVEEAIRLFEQGNYMEKLDKALKHSQQADELKEVAEQAKEQATKDSLKALQSLKAQIEAYKLNNEWDKAGELLKGLVDRLNTVNDCCAYADFCNNQNDFEEAEDYYKRALTLIENYPKDIVKRNLGYKANVLMNLANIYLKSQNFHESEQIYTEALKIYRKLVSQEPSIYEKEMAMVLNNLGILYTDSRRYQESEEVHREALEIRQRIAKVPSDETCHDVAQSLFNLGYLFMHTERFQESVKMYNEALSFFQKFVENRPEYVAPTALLLTNLGNVYYQMSNYSDSEEKYQQALKMYQRLVQNNPNAYVPAMARTIRFIANLYSHTQRLSESEAMYKEALEIYRRLAQKNPQAYGSDLARTLYNQAGLYSDTQRFAESEAMYKESLDIYRRLSEQNPQTYEPDVAMTLNGLAILYSDTQRFSESEEMYKEALAIRRRLAQSNPQAYESALATTLYNIGLLKVRTEHYADAISSFEEALNIYRRLAQINPAEQQWYESSLYGLSLLYPAVNNYLSAYNINKEWLPILKQKYEAEPDTQKEDYTTTLGSQSFYAIFAKQYAEAEQYAHEGLAVDSTKHFIYANLAAALLFQGKYTEAETFYRQYKSELKDGFLDDFRQYADAGVIPPECEADVEKIKKLLSE